MSHHNTAFHQLLHPLSRHEFEGLTKQHHHGQKLRSASRGDQFIGITMSQLSGRQSLRDIESSLRSQELVCYPLKTKRRLQGHPSTQAHKHTSTQERGR